MTTSESSHILKLTLIKQSLRSQLKPENFQELVQAKTTLEIRHSEANYSD